MKKEKRVFEKRLEGFVGPGVAYGRPFARLEDMDEECPLRRLPGSRVRRLEGLLLIEKDLEFALEAMTELRSRCLEQKQDIMSQALWISGIVSYARSFLEARGRKVKLSEKNCFRNGREIRETHQEMIELRHNYMAHGGESINENACVYVILHPDLNQKSVLGFAPIVSEAISVVPETVDRYLIAIRTALDACRRQVEGQWSLIKAWVEQQPVDKLYALAE